jgi:NAD(P)-dependent dehydrogenase (short-subunit alcohol dehydrogenase family)
VAARLDGRVVVITGAGGGIGRACANGCAAEGARVVIAEIDSDLGQETANEVQASGGEALAIPTDVGDWPSVQSMAATVLDRFGRVDGLVNNAALLATLERRPFDQISEDEWDRVMLVNVKGVWNCCRALVPAMRRQRYGKIVNLSSDVVLSGVPGLLHYVSSKGAVLSMTRSLAREVGSDNVCVNAIAPGFTETRAALAHAGDARERSVRARAIQRAEVPQDLVGSVVFLLSGDSDFVTGVLLPVNGGYIMH